MSLTVSENLNAETSTDSKPQDFILHTFNAFDPDIARNPNNLFNKTSNFLKDPLIDKQIITQTFKQTFSFTTSKYESSQESNSEFAASMGIEGSYGFFSGSLKSSYEHDTYQKSTSFSSSYNGFLDCGSVTFYQPSNYHAIKACLSDDLCEALESIASLQDAQAFTNTYGTHLIGGLKLGGFIKLKSQADTGDYNSKEKLSVEVTAAYKGAGDISTAASMAQSLSKSSHSYAFSESASVSGGSMNLAAAIDPANKDTVIAWAQSCTPDTAYSITNSVELFLLADNKQAQSILQEFINLTIISHSIGNPTIFSQPVNLAPYFLVNVDAVASDSKFRIIGGGASLAKDGSSFLVNSYPHLDSQTGEIIGWRASSHDIANPADQNSYLTSYAVAIYDPTYSAGSGSLLQVQVKTGFGSNPGRGGDSATAQIDAGFLLSCGGIRSETSQNAQKYILSSYPVDGSTWKVENHDYEHPATDVNLTAFAVGIKSGHPALVIEASRVATDQSQHEYGNQIAQLGGSICIAGGGVSVENATGCGNLVQQNYPASANTWAEYDKDDDGNVSYANCAAYAIGFTGKLVLSQ